MKRLALVLLMLVATPIVVAVAAVAGACAGAVIMWRDTRDTARKWRVPWA